MITINVETYRDGLFVATAILDGQVLFTAYGETAAEAIDLAGKAGKSLARGATTACPGT